MYLPTEGLFAEVVRRGGLVHTLRTKHRIVIAGPTTLTALVSSLSMGFTTLAIQKRSSDASRLLGEVKTEFEKSAGVWEKLSKQLETASHTVEAAGVRHRAISRRLRSVNAVPEGASIAAAALPEEPCQQELQMMIPAQPRPGIVSSAFPPALLLLYAPPGRPIRPEARSRDAATRRPHDRPPCGPGWPAGSFRPWWRTTRAGRSCPEASSPHATTRTDYGIGKTQSAGGSGPTQLS